MKAGCRKSALLIWANQRGQSFVSNHLKCESISLYFCQKYRREWQLCLSTCTVRLWAARTGGAEATQKKKKLFSPSSCRKTNFHAEVYESGVTELKPCRGFCSIHSSGQLILLSTALQPGTGTTWSDGSMNGWNKNTAGLLLSEDGLHTSEKPYIYIYKRSII